MSKGKELRRIKAVKRSIDRSLQLLQTEVIDIMQIHFGPNPEEVLERGETVAAMKDARKEGKIRFLGASIDRELALLAAANRIALGEGIQA